MHLGTHFKAGMTVMEALIVHMYHQRLRRPLGKQLRYIGPAWGRSLKLLNFPHSALVLSKAPHQTSPALAKLAIPSNPQ